MILPDSFPQQLILFDKCAYSFRNPVKSNNVAVVHAFNF